MSFEVRFGPESGVTYDALVQQLHEDGVRKLYCNLKPELRNA